MLIESESERPIVLSFMAERTRFPAPGLAGGGAGGLGDVQINGKKVDHRRQHVLEQGDACCEHAGRRGIWAGGAAGGGAAGAGSGARIRGRRKTPHPALSPEGRGGEEEEEAYFRAIEGFAR